MTSQNSLNILPLAVDTPLQNYVWLIVNQQRKQAIAVDPTSAEVVQNYLQQHGLALIAIWITHDHFDHIAGVAALKTSYPACDIIAHQQHQLKNNLVPDSCVGEGSVFSAWEYQVRVWSLEGHKKYHVGYILQDADNRQHAFSGDILFSAGCGRNFEGTLDELFASLQRLASLPDDTLFYPTHEFTVNNLNFANSILPEDSATLAAIDIAHAKREHGLPTLPVTLADEKRMNVFLRTTEAVVIAAVESQTQLENTSPQAVFAALRGLKDAF